MRWTPRWLLGLVLGGCASGQTDGSAIAAPSAAASPSAVAAPSAVAPAAPSGTSSPSNAPEVREEPPPALRNAQYGCPSTLRVESGQSFEEISLRCFGSRTYQDFLSSHNQHERKGLRAGETLKIPSFETLARENVAAKWKSDMSAVAAAYTHFLGVQPEIEAQLRGQKPGMGRYQPSPAAKLELDAAASALRPVVEHLRAAGVRTKKFAQAVEAFEQLAKGDGSFSTDYATEEIHQCFSYGISALRK
ncbi:hypothetical protein [Polyangium sp. y55x31]|uniref:hypothetical protein n=1 Tax=Polyangium sp. y55x31 TaxID=3042688 RepID=UPI0024827792|nr:hypothetical protein [Polyangium sp. y55x31]MDI1476081.1 hypothetical protein [Polyangium sp. y55x31]